MQNSRKNSGQNSTQSSIQSSIMMVREEAATGVATGHRGEGPSPVKELEPQGGDIARPEAGTRVKGRIETQIHRRKKVKAVLPLEAEWDSRSAQGPRGLRMPPDHMRK